MFALVLYLRVHHWYGYPVVAPEEPALGTKFAELLNNVIVAISVLDWLKFR